MRSVLLEEHQYGDLCVAEEVPNYRTRIFTGPRRKGDDHDQTVDTRSDRPSGNIKPAVVTPSNSQGVVWGIRRWCALYVHGRRAEQPVKWRDTIDVVHVDAQGPTALDDRGERAADAPFDLNHEGVARPHDPDRLVGLSRIEDGHRHASVQRVRREKVGSRRDEP